MDIKQENLTFKKYFIELNKRFICIIVISLLIFGFLTLFVTYFVHKCFKSNFYSTNKSYKYSALNNVDGN